MYCLQCLLSTSKFTKRIKFYATINFMSNMTLDEKQNRHDKMNTMREAKWVENLSKQMGRKIKQIWPRPKGEREREGEEEGGGGGTCQLWLHPPPAWPGDHVATPDSPAAVS